MLEGNVETLEAPKRLRPYLEGLGIAEHGPFDSELETETGADLFIEEFFPDDIHLTRARIEMNIERANAEGDISEAMIVADATLLRIMLEFFDAEGRAKGLESEDFYIRQDAELRNYVKNCMREAVEAELGETPTDSLLDARIEQVQGFPPYSYVEVEEDEDSGDRETTSMGGGSLDVAALAMATTGLRRAA